jgi:uncharacterized RDD family membrane protein YckC
MKHRSMITFGLFAISQFALWLISAQDNMADGDEIMIFTVVVSLFLGLFFFGYTWTRWVATILLAVIGVFLVSATLEGFGFGFTIIAFLYGVVILTLFNHTPETKSAQSTEPVTDESVLDASFIAPTPTVEGEFYVDEVMYEYPLLVKRYQSLLIDFFLLFTIMVVTMVILGQSEARQTVVVSLGAIFVLIYEPVLTTYSATLGQRIMGIRVRDMKNPRERINILQAYIRLLVKWILGWLSFVTINFNREHRAIHDLAGSSVVIKVK